MAPSKMLWASLLTICVATLCASQPDSRAPNVAGSSSRATTKSTGVGDESAALPMSTDNGSKESDDAKSHHAVHPRHRRLPAEWRLVFPQAPRSVRSLQQSLEDAGEEGRCQLTSSAIASILDVETRTWLIDHRHLDDISHDLQTLVDCSSDGDTILFNTTRPITPPRRIEIPWNLTLSAAVDAIDLENGVFPKSESPTTFTCPEGDGVFSIKTGTALIANIVFKNCTLDEQDGAIVQLDECTSKEASGTVRLHRVAFRGHRLNGTSAFSSGAECASVEMIRVKFSNNSCGDACFAQLAAAADMRHVRLERNVPVASLDTRRPVSLLRLLAGSTTKVVDIHLSQNAVAGIHVSDGTLNLTQSTFERNSEGPTVRLDQGSRAHIADCVFRGNEASIQRAEETLPESLLAFESSGFRCVPVTMTRGSALLSFDSDVRVKGCEFRNNTVHGDASGIFASGGTLEVDACSFRNNSATKAGGAVYLLNALALFDNVVCVDNSAEDGGGCLFAENATGWIVDSRLKGNSASKGGALCIKESAEMQIQNSSFVGNSAEESGGGAHVQAEFCRFVECRFERNKARTGGGLNVDKDSVVRIERSTFVQNNASDSGGGMSSERSVVELEAIELTGNRASSQGGAVRVKEESTIRVRDSQFRENSAGIYGGAMVVQNSKGTLSGCEVERNVADIGGGIELSRTSSLEIRNNSEFVENRARNGVGGGIDCQGRSELKISDAEFRDNNASRQGGAIFLYVSSLNAARLVMLDNVCGDMGAGVFLYGKSTAEFSDSLFQRNRAEYGGAVFVRESQVHVRGSKFFDCRAEKNGGGIYIESQSVVVFEGSASEFLWNIAAGGEGGGVYCSDGNLTGESLSFVKNYAADGGGIAMNMECEATLSLVNFRANNASRGGGLYVTGGSRVDLRSGSFEDSQTSEMGAAIHVELSFLKLRGATFLNGTSQTGGFVTCRGANVTIRNSQADIGLASETGGFMDASESSNVSIANLSLSGMRARTGGAFHLAASNLRARGLSVNGSSAGESGGGIHADQGSSILCLKCAFEGNAAGRSGGGVSIASAEPQQLVYQFDGCHFSNNSATLGGGIHYLSNHTAPDCGRPEANCTLVTLGGVVLKNNSAECGGGIFTSDPTAFRFRCPEHHERDELGFYSERELDGMRVLRSDKDLCADAWSGNTEINFGPDVATYARRILWFIEDGSGPEAETIQIEETRKRIDYKSGEPLPKIRLEVVDAFGQGPAFGAGNATVAAVMWSPSTDPSKSNALFPGNVSLLMVDGTAEFSEIRGLQTPNDCLVRIDFSEDALPTLEIDVTVRDCIIGEAPNNDRTLCVPCSQRQCRVSKKDDQCQPCPENANCSSINVIQPDRKYWHRHPCSVHMQECLSRTACDFDREEGLTTVTAEMQDCTFSQMMDEDYSQTQCREGYTGLLCGDCEAGYGHSSSFDCDQCDTGLSIATLAISIMLVLALSSFAIRSSLVPVQNPRRDARASRRRMSRRFIGVATSAPASIQLAPLVSRSNPPPRSRHTQNEASQEDGGESSAVMAKWKTVEIFKITINFLQVMSVAIYINANWTSSSTSLISATDAVGGMMSGRASFSAECLAPANAVVARPVIRAIISFAIPVVAVLLYGIFWLCMACRSAEGWHYFKKRWLLSVVAVAYLTYVWITKTAANTLYCIRVHDSVDVDVDTMHRYWSQDTSLRCYRGPHAVLAFTLGWPVIVAFTVGFPAFLYYNLRNSRSSDGRPAAVFMEIAAFLYRAYSDDFRYWELVIMCRKALLTVVAVFGYHLGFNLQAVLAVCVLTTALYLHISARPFRKEFDALNAYEGASLFVSNITFVLALLYDDNRTRDATKTFLNVLLCALVGGLFLTFFCLFVQSGLIHLRLVLEEEGIIDDAQRQKSIAIVKTFVTTTLEQCWSQMKKMSFKTKPSSEEEEAL